MKRLFMAGGVALSVLLLPLGGWLPAASAATNQVVIYNSIPSPLPGNLPSEGAQPEHFNELGDKIAFAGSVRHLSHVIVTMDSWACETGGSTTHDCATTPGATFSEPITFNIYQAGPGDAIGPRIATETKTFAIPYRPSEDDVHCTGNNAGAWYDSATNSCYFGMAVNVGFDFSAQNVTLPNTVIYGISYNTTTFGYQPYGTGTACFNTSPGCPYDSLNIGFVTSTSVGTDVDPSRAYENSPDGPYYCDNGAAGTGTFRVDSPSNGCWDGYTPAVEFTATNSAVGTGFGPCSSTSTCPSVYLVNNTNTGGRQVSATFQLTGTSCTGTAGSCNFNYQSASLSYRDSGPGGIVIPTCSQTSTSCPLFIDSFQCTSTSSATVSGRYVTGGVTHTFTLQLTAGTSSTGQGGSFTIIVDGTYTYTGTMPQIVKVSCPTFSQTP
jgi:hypothetical protein